MIRRQRFEKERVEGCLLGKRDKRGKRGKGETDTSPWMIFLDLKKIYSVERGRRKLVEAEEGFKETVEGKAATDP